MAVRPLGKVQSEDGFQDDAFTRQFVLDKLTHYSEMLREYDAGTVTRVATRTELAGFMENWLETLVELDELQCTGDGCRLCAKGVADA